MRKRMTKAEWGTWVSTKFIPSVMQMSPARLRGFAHVLETEAAVSSTKEIFAEMAGLFRDLADERERADA